MYLAGLIADDEKMTKADLQTWAKQATSGSLCEYIVPGWQPEVIMVTNWRCLWIDGKEENIMAAGWATLSWLVSLKPDSELDLPELKKLLARVAKTIHSADNRVRYTMNGFVIAVGAYVAALNEEAIVTAKMIGVVMVDMNGTACKVPDAVTYIGKATARGSLTKKKKDG